MLLDGPTIDLGTEGERDLDVVRTSLPGGLAGDPTTMGVLVARAWSGAARVDVLARDAGRHDSPAAVLASGGVVDQAVRRTARPPTR